MIRRSCSFAAVALALAALTPGMAFSQDNTPADASSAANVPPSVGGAELQRVEARRRQLFAQMLADPSNLDVAFEYAGLSAQAGDLEAAISTLERMLIFAPGLPRLQLELGVLYYRLGAYDTAQLYFQNAVAAPNVPEVVKARVDPYLAAIEERTATSQFSGVITTGVRYQTNATAATDAEMITAFGLPFILNPSALADEDYNAFVTASFFYSKDLENQGDRFETRLLTYGALYGEHDEINIGLAELTAGPVFDLERFNLENSALGIYGIANGVLLGEDPYLASGGAGISLVTLAGPRTRLSSQYEYRREEFQDSQQRPTASDRTGDRFRGEHRIQHQVSERFGIFAALEGDRRSAERDFLSVWEVAASAGWTIAFASPFPKQERHWSIGFSGGYALRYFDEPDPVFSTTDEEKDRDAFVLGTIGIPFGETWSLQGQAGYRRVTSNYEIKEFDNAHGSVAVSKRF